jgi:predicted nucleic acid-binding Zn ribbon protein
METRLCSICNSAIVGRIDKKYCSDQCRYIGNNKNKQQNETTIIETNRVLRKNRTILKKLCPAGKATVRREVLEGMGYDTATFSSLFITAKKEIYYLCYDYGFTPIVQNGIQKVLIITRQAYMNFPDPWKYVKQPDTSMGQADINDQSKA